MKILVINGVNMNMLGFRETEKYGTMTLKDLEKDLYAFSFVFVLFECLSRIIQIFSRNKKLPYQ